jgi:hypothetical protein
MIKRPAKMRPPVWRRIWDAFCPRCDRSLSIRGKSSGFFWFCHLCLTERPLTPADEARNKNRRGIA